MDTRKHGLLFVFAAGILWSTVGLGIRMIEGPVQHLQTQYYQFWDAIDWRNDARNFA
jgi:hypothetical protein